MQMQRKKFLTQYLIDHVAIIVSDRFYPGVGGGVNQDTGEKRAVLRSTIAVVDNAPTPVLFRRRSVDWLRCKQRALWP